MEIGRRLAKRVVGIGLPRHFVIQYDDGDYSAYLDPFHGGTILSPEDCYRLAQVEDENPRLLAPACKQADRDADDQQSARHLFFAAVV